MKQKVDVESTSELVFANIYRPKQLCLLVDSSFYLYFFFTERSHIISQNSFNTTKKLNQQFQCFPSIIITETYFFFHLSHFFRCHMGASENHVEGTRKNDTVTSGERELSCGYDLRKYPRRLKLKRKSQIIAVCSNSTTWLHNKAIISAI